MFITTKTEYGLEALLYLAEHYYEGCISIVKICKETKLKQAYVETIFLLMKHRGLVRSVKGNQGGYQLAMPIDKLTLYDVISACEGSCDYVSYQSTIDKLDYFLKDELWNQLNQEVISYTKAITLKDILDKRISEDMYYI